MAHVGSADLVVVGAGAAGLATAIFAARGAPGLRVRCFDGAKRVGAKILVSGGSRCNVTNAVVTEKDYWGGSSRVVRRVLHAFPAPRAAAFFEEIGVRLHEEEDGKLFPDTNRSRTVLDALLAECARLGVRLETGARVIGVEKAAAGLLVGIEGGDACTAPAVVLATGGRSLPKTGSDGFGYELARRLGHGYVETTPALVPLVLGSRPDRGAGPPPDGDGGIHAPLSGVSHPATIRVLANGRSVARLDGSMLWTHFGASGPAILNASRHWHRVRLQGATADVVLGLLPGETFETIDEWLQAEARERPRAKIGTVLATRLPAAVARSWAWRTCDPETLMAHLARDARRRLAHAMSATRLDVLDSRGYGYAEVTAGGVPLDEIDPATMQSARCPGLYLAGEILDVDGRLGGFNFQWAWSSGWVAGQAIAREAARR